MSNYTPLQCSALAVYLLVAPALSQSGEPTWQQPRELQKPREFQVPGEIRAPSGTWQVPRGFQLVENREYPCELHLVASADALFDFASAELNSAGEEALADVLTQIRQRVPHTIVVRGHTDNIGTSSANVALSERRAEAVGDWLIKRLGQHTQLEIEALGKTQPVAQNQTTSGTDDPQGRARNRRVEVILRAGSQSKDC